MPTVPRPSHIPEPSRLAWCCLLVCAAATLFLATLGPLVDYDLWFDLRMGQTIVATHSVPHELSFLSTSRFFSPMYWVNDEWLFSACVWEIYHHAGYVGLAMTKSLLLTLFGLLIYAGCRQGKLAPPLALGMTWLGVLMSRGRFMLRPQLFTMCFMAALACIILRQRDGKPSGVPPGLALLFWLWGNLHGGVNEGFGVLAAFLLVSALVSWRRDSWGQDRAWLMPLAWGLVGGILLSVLRPGTYRILLYPGEFFHRQFQQYIVEWAATPPDWWQTWLGAFVAIAIAVFSVALWRRCFMLAEAVVVCCLFTWTLLHNRFVGELAAAGCPFVAAQASVALAGWGVRLRSRCMPLGAALAAGLVIVTLCRAAPAAAEAAISFEPSSHFYPIGGLRWLREHPIAGVVYNSYQLGGFMVWSDVPPFIHGINPLYPDSLLKDYLSIEQDASLRWELLQKYDAGACLLSWPSGENDVIQRLQEALYAREDWSLVYFDDACLLFVKGRPPTPPFRALRPGLDEPIGPGLEGEAEIEVRRCLAADPSCRAFQDLWIRCAVARRDTTAVLQRADRWLAVQPDDVDARLLRATVEGVDSAVADLRQAARLRPESAIVRYDLAVALIRVAQHPTPHSMPAGQALAQAQRALQDTLRLAPDFAPARTLLQQLKG